MKIIHVITAFGIGGAEKLLLNIMNKQVEEHSVHLIYFKSIDDLLPKLNNKIIVENIPFSFFITKKLKSYFKEHNPDIIHTHLGHADFLGLFSAKNIKCKLFCTMHNIYFKKNFIDFIIFAVYRFILLKNVNVISISKSVESHVVNRLKVSKKRSYLLSNAIPNGPFVLEKKSSDEINLLFVGRLTKQKSVVTLIKAIKELKKKNLKKRFKLIIIGDGNMKESLMKLSEDLGVRKNIQFMGEQKDINEYYLKADIFVLPSIWEGFGIVILEAFSAKVAVIASNIEGPAEIIKNKINGLLFEPEDYVQLSEKLMELINNKKLRIKIANNGHKSFTKKYHIDSYVKKLIKLYENA